jgi:methyl-galactoside transport system permease protein
VGLTTLSGTVRRRECKLTGVLIFQVLDNGLVVLGVSPYSQQIVKGIIIVAAVGIDIRKYVLRK